jgi:hypothetical protein
MNMSNYPSNVLTLNEFEGLINKPPRGLDNIKRRCEPTIEIPPPNSRLLPKKPKEINYCLNEYDLWEFIQDQPRKYPRFLFDHENCAVYGIQLDYGLVGKLNSHFKEICREWNLSIDEEKSITQLSVQ